jgi:hypothetical protein
VDLSHHPVGLVWRRSSRCNGGACVEVAELDEMIIIRDSAEPGHTLIAVSRDVWRDFLSWVQTRAHRMR